MPEVATKLTRVTLDSAQVISTGSIKVYGICAINGSASNVVVQFKDNDSNNKLDVAVLAHDSSSWDVPWIADNGLNIANLSNSSVVVTVAHSADGV